MVSKTSPQRKQGALLMDSFLQNQAEKYALHLSSLCDIPVSVMDAVNKKFVYKSCDFCSGCTHPKCNEMHTHLYGSSEAVRWGGKYIYYCHMGLVFIASPLCNENGNMDGSLIAGPLVMGELTDTLCELPVENMKESVKSLPVFQTPKVNSLAEILRLKAISSKNEQSEILDSLYLCTQYKDSSLENIIDYEKRLQTAISSNDIHEAKSILNEITGNILLSGSFDLPSIKTRCLELIVLISRSAIDAGADVNLILNSNDNYIQKIEQFSSIEELSVWLTEILYRFINVAVELSQARHSDMIYKTMEYVKSNYSEKFSLDDIAAHIFLSRSYISSVFKKETGKSLSSYINYVRIEKSKQILLDRSVSLVDVAGLCGFDDQSYFSKVFKKSVGISPKKFRDAGGKI